METPSDFPKAKEHSKLGCDGRFLRVCGHLRNLLNGAVDFHMGVRFNMTRGAEAADFGTAKAANPSAHALEASPLSRGSGQNHPPRGAEESGPTGRIKRQTKPESCRFVGVKYAMVLLTRNQPESLLPGQKQT